MKIIWILSLLLTCNGASFAANPSYPQPIEIIDKSQANYLTPENTMSALKSALLSEDLYWADETITPESLREQIQLFEKANIDRYQLCELEKKIKESFIVDKISYKDAVVLIIEAYGYNGSIKRVPVPLQVNENGLWMITNKYKGDKDLHQYISYVPPLFGGKANSSAKPADNDIYPQQINIIDRTQANYLSPENTMSARRSALLNDDSGWVDETLTRESFQEQVQDYQEAGIDRSQLSDLEKKVKEIFIVNKIPYKDAVLLVVDAYGYDGSIQRLPFPFIKENGLWKFTNKFAEDEILLDYLYYVPPLFDGKGQKPNDANSFLGYEQPTQVQTELTAGTDKYTLHIYFGKTIEPATFTAELNKNDITSQFSPAPFTDQEVELALQPGRNVLVLSIAGTRQDGKKAKDTDRLVFIVQ